MGKLRPYKEEIERLLLKAEYGGITSDRVLLKISAFCDERAYQEARHQMDRLKKEYAFDSNRHICTRLRKIANGLGARERRPVSPFVYPPRPAVPHDRAPPGLRDLFFGRAGPAQAGRAEGGVQGEERGDG